MLAILGGLRHHRSQDLRLRDNCNKTRHNKSLSRECTAWDMHAVSTVDVVCHFLGTFPHKLVETHDHLTVTLHVRRPSHLASLPDCFLTRPSWPWRQARSPAL